MADLYVDPWDLSDAQVADRYSKLSRRLNDRMRELESHGITTDALEKYQVLVQDLAEENKRLPKNIPESHMRSALERVQNILETPGSSWKQTKEFALRGMKTFKEKYGINFRDVKQYNDFWRSENIQKFKSAYGSQAANAVAKMQASEDDELRKAVEDFIADDEMEADDMLEALGFESEADLLRTIAESRRANEGRYG